MNTKLPVVISLTVLLSTTAVAHEDGVYESLGHIPVGRIFLSPEERARLDKIRGRVPAAPGRTRPTGSPGKRTFDKDAAGFIISDSGTTRVWKNGDFVPADSASRVRFPGQVRVAGQAEPRTDDETGNDEAAAEPPVETGDEQE